MLDDTMLKKQNSRDKLFVLLFLYNKNMNIMRPITDNDVAVYGITFSAGFVAVAFAESISLTLTLIAFNCLSPHLAFCSIERHHNLHRLLLDALCRGNAELLALLSGFVIVVAVVPVMALGTLRRRHRVIR